MPETVPVPDPAVLIFNVWLSENCAVTMVFAFIVKEHVLELEVHVPAEALDPLMVHPVNIDPLSTVRVSTTDAPEA